MSTSKLSTTKKLVASTLTGFFAAAIMAVPAFAVDVPATGYCGASETGCTTAGDQTTCYGAGAFGAFGTYGFKHDFRGGANGTQTGINNSNLCGNPQN